jgi:hypothetical protein
LPGRYHSCITLIVGDNAVPVKVASAFGQLITWLMGLTMLEGTVKFWPMVNVCADTELVAKSVTCTV